MRVLCCQRSAQARLVCLRVHASVHGLVRVQANGVVLCVYVCTCMHVFGMISIFTPACPCVAHVCAPVCVSACVPVRLCACACVPVCVRLCA